MHVGPKSRGHISHPIQMKCSTNYVFGPGKLLIIGPNKIHISSIFNIFFIKHFFQGLTNAKIILNFLQIGWSMRF